MDNEEIDVLFILGELAKNNIVDNDNSFLSLVSSNDQSYEEISDLIDNFPEDISSFINLTENDDYKWRLNFNKKYLNDKEMHFFVSQENFTEWLRNEQLLERGNFFTSSQERKYIFVHGIEKTFIGPKLNICPTGVIEVNYEEELIFPSNEIIKAYVNVLADNLILEPLSYSLYNYDNNQFCKVLLSNSVKTQCFILANEIDKNDNITFKGVKRIDISVDEIDLEFTDLIFLKDTLNSTINWVFEEKTQTRKQLIVNRISLEIDPLKPLTEQLLVSLPYALKEAKEKYNFIIQDLSDDYDSELRSLQSKVLDEAKIFRASLKTTFKDLAR